MGKQATQVVNQLHESEARWFAVRTGYKREKQVLKRLSARGLEAYLPIMTVTRHYTRKTKTVELPLFTCYVFVKITKSAYVPVLEDPDVSGFVKIAKDLIAIPEEEITLLRRIVGEQIKLEAQPIRFELGDEVELIHGQLTGLRGKLVDKGNQKQLVVDLQHIGFSLRLEVAPAHLRLLRRTVALAG